METTRVLKRPVISEKSFSNAENGKYVFIVDNDTNKIEIKKTVEKLFKVNVTDVTTVKVKGKVKRTRKSIGRRSDYKKAYVTLKEGQKIEDFKGL